METNSITLVVVLLNAILTPLFQYLINSRCDSIKLCCGLCDIHRVVKKSDNEIKTERDIEEGQL
jgi:hypothetical protein